jgi:hypothetical protein
MRPPPPLDDRVVGLLRGIAETNAVPPNTEWSELAAALEVASRENAYLSSEVLASEALFRIESCPAELRKAVIRRSVDGWVAAGRTAEVLPLLARQADALPESGYRPENFVAQLPPNLPLGGDRHLVYRALREGALSPPSLLEWLRSQSSSVVRPELELFRCFALGQLGDAEASGALTRYLEFYRTSKVIYPARIASNVLEEIPSSPLTPRRDGPLVSVVCSAYRAASTLRYAVSSLLNQTHGNLEVLLCDDGSDDETPNVARELAETDERIRLFRSKGNQGTYNVRNGLLPFARGKYVTFHDSDDYALPARLETQLAAIELLAAKACVSNWLRVLPNGLFVFFRDGKEQRLSIVSLMVERELLMSLLPYRSARHSADLELFDRLIATVGHSAVARVKAPLLFGLWSAQSLTRGQGSEALENGYRAPSRRHFAEICFRQRLFGADLISDRQIDEALVQTGNYKPARGVEPLVR